MKANSTPPKKAEPGVLILLLAAIILTVIGRSLKDARQVPYGSFGGLVWLTVLAVSFLFGLLFFARFVLPLGGNEGWSEGLRLLWRLYYLQADQYLNQLFGPRPATQRQSRRARRRTTAPVNDSGLPASFKKIGAGILKSHQILAVVKGSEFVRAAGPGFVILYKREGANLLIDLRNQVRRQAVKASTRDGIPIETAVSVTFRVQPVPVAGLGPEPYPYDREAIFHICYNSSIDEQAAIRDWTQQIAPHAASLLFNLLPRYTLDDLYHPGNGVSIADQIKAQIKDQLARQMALEGIEILGVGVDKFTLPPEVTEQRIKTWQAEWERRITIQHAAGDAEAVRRLKLARARAQVEIIENITQNITNVRQTGGTDLPNIIMLRMIEALEEAKSSPSLQALLPPQIFNLVQDSSIQIQAWIDQTGETQEKGS